jgi:hypothetical protein
MDLFGYHWIFLEPSPRGGAGVFPGIRRSDAARLLPVPRHNPNDSCGLSRTGTMVPSATNSIPCRCGCGPRSAQPHDQQAEWSITQDHNHPCVSTAPDTHTRRWNDRDETSTPHRQDGRQPAGNRNIRAGGNPHCPGPALDRPLRHAIRRDSRQAHPSPVTSLAPADVIAPCVRYAPPPPGLRRGRHARPPRRGGEFLNAGTGGLPREEPEVAAVD